MASFVTFRCTSPARDPCTKTPNPAQREPATSRGTLRVPPATASSYTLFMNRRQFLYTSAAGLALSATSYASGKPRRVGLIGPGWYGKTDLFRLIQVAPVEVVSLCDVDKQKPSSVDIREGQAMLAAARKHQRVVQVGTQRRSTPHIVEARDRFIKEGKLGKIGLVEMCCYYHMRATENPPDTDPPPYLDYDMWTGPAPMRPYNRLVHPRGWRAFMEYGNGIVGDMCIHMFDMVRWMLGLGWPKRVSSEGGILVDKRSKANISDTQTATFDYDDLKIVWQHRTWGAAPDPDPNYAWSSTFYGDKGTLKVSVYSYDFVPEGGKGAVHRDVTYELEQYPVDKTEADLERHVAPAVRHHMKDFLAAIDARSKPVADIEEGYISTASCILANMSMKLGRTLAWDPQAGRIAGDDAANRLLARPYRAPWVHPA